MTTGTVSVIAPRGSHISGNHPVLIEPGVRVSGLHSVVIGGGHIVGRQPVTAFHDPGIITPPPVTVTGFRLGGAGIHYQILQPLSYEIRYSANDMAWEMRAEFPLNSHIQAITVTLGGAPVTFEVLHRQSEMDYRRRIQTVRAVYSLMDFLSESWCLPESALYQSAKVLIQTLLTGHSVVWQAADFIIGPEIYLGLSSLQTRNQILREILELASAIMIIRADGSILIRDSAPDLPSGLPLFARPILNIRQDTPAPAPVTGVMVSIYGQRGGPFMDTRIIDESTALAPRYKVKIHAWPARPELSNKSQTPGSPVFDAHGVFSDTEEIEENVDFRNGRAKVRPKLTEIINLELNPSTGQFTRTVLPPVSLLGWQGPDLGTITHQPDGTLRAAVPGNSTARLTIRREYYYVTVVRSSSIGGVFPAGHDFSQYPDDNIFIQFSLKLPGVEPAGLALVRTASTGKVSDQVAIAPDNKLIAYTGQRFLRQANARSMTIEVAGQAMEAIGQIIDTGHGAMIVDSGRLTVDGRRITTTLEGRILH